MNLAALSIRRPILISMVLSVFLLFGGLAYFTLPLNLMPDVQLGYVTIQTIYPGAGPREVEIQVTKRLEDAVATISKIDEITSFSMESISIMVIKFDLGKDVDVANQEVKDKVGGILNQLPEDVQRPVIGKFDITAQPVMDLVLSGSLDSRELYDLADLVLKDRLSQVEGVARVNILGGTRREIRVELDDRLVFSNALSLSQLSGLLAAQNLNMPAGQFQKGDREYAVRLQGELPELEVLRRLEIPTPFGKKRLEQLGEVLDSGAEVRQRTIYFNNETGRRNDRAVLLQISQSADGNTVEMARQVRRALPGIRRELPAGCELKLVRDDSVFIQSSVDDTMSNIFLGVLLTGLVLLFFLHDLRSTIIVALAMPMSIISTFMLLQVMDFSLNIMSLMGLSSSVGILVANSVVVLENIFRHKQMGHGRRRAAESGTTEIAVAVLASTLTNLVVFLPIATMSSLVGQFFKEFALTVSFATIFSLIISFTLTPMLASLILPEQAAESRRLGKALEALFNSWERFYQSLLSIILKSRGRSALVLLGDLVLFAASLLAARKVGFEFMPQLDEGNIAVTVELPQGTNLDATAAKIAEIENIVRRHPEVRYLLTTLGSLGDVDKGTNLARMQVKLVDADQREVSSNRLANEIMGELAGVTNARITVSAQSSQGSGMAPVTFYLLGADDDLLDRYARILLKELKKVPGLINLNTSSRSGKPEITLVPLRDRLSDAGLTVYDLAFTLRAALEGVVATRFRRAGEEYEFRLSLRRDEVDTPEEIALLPVATPLGMRRLADFAEIRYTEGFSKILHKDKFKAVEFTGDNAPGVPLGDVTNAVKKVVAGLGLPEGYRVDWGGDAKLMEETTMDMARTFIIAIILTYMLLAAILESFLQPLLILGTVPLAMIGVFLALWLTGINLNTISMMAIITLVGIVVNNAILLLDYTNLLRRQGLDARSALVEACPTKLKAVIMATVAIILGMLPMALGMGSAGREFRIPMGVVAIGGLSVSTLFTLLLIPALYLLFSRDARKAGGGDHE